MRNSVWMLSGVLALTSAAAMAADADSAASGSNQLPWARWQGRLSLGSAPAPWRLGADQSSTPKLAGASLVGDYYFSGALTGPRQLGGFRATSGLIFGPRSAPSTGQPGLAAGGGFGVAKRYASVSALTHASDATSENATQPYLGLGYTNLSVRSGWGFSADLGLVGQSSASAVRLGRAFNGSQNLDDKIRDMRMTPLLQLGVTYSF